MGKNIQGKSTQLQGIKLMYIHANMNTLILYYCIRGKLPYTAKHWGKLSRLQGNFTFCWKIFVGFLALQIQVQGVNVKNVEKLLQLSKSPKVFPLKCFAIYGIPGRKLLQWQKDSSICNKTLWLKCITCCTFSEVKLMVIIKAASFLPVVISRIQYQLYSIDV